MDLTGAAMEHFLVVNSVRKEHSSYVATFGPLTHGSLTLAMLAELILDVI